MGMDVYGKNPVSDRGEYFRNNVWWWRPLWNYCVSVAPHLCSNVNGHMNDGDGLDADGALALSEALILEISLGRTYEYEEKYNKRLASLPRHECEYCKGTGVRTDEVGVNLGMPAQVIDPDMAVILGRTHGWCNSCHGEGMCDHFDTNYSFTAENVLEFAEFLADSGGFSIC